MVLLCGGLAVAVGWNAIWSRQAVYGRTEDGVHDAVVVVDDVAGESGHTQEATLHMPAVWTAECRHLVAGSADQVLDGQGMEVSCEPVLVQGASEIGAGLDAHGGHQVDRLDQMTVGCT